MKTYSSNHHEVIESDGKLVVAGYCKVELEEVSDASLSNPTNTSNTASTIKRKFSYEGPTIVSDDEVRLIIPSIIYSILCQNVESESSSTEEKDSEKHPGQPSGPSSEA